MTFNSHNTAAPRLYCLLLRFYLFIFLLLKYLLLNIIMNYMKNSDVVSKGLAHLFTISIFHAIQV